MKVKFKKCDLELTQESIESLTVESDYLLLKIESSKLVRNPAKPYACLETVRYKKIVTCSYHPNIIIVDHDYLRPNDDKIIGYCPLVFSDTDEKLPIKL